MIAKAPFGRTGHTSTRTLFGAAALGRVTQAEADETLDCGDGGPGHRAGDGAAVCVAA